MAKCLVCKTEDTGINGEFFWVNDLDRGGIWVCLGCGKEFKEEEVNKNENRKVVRKNDGQESMQSITGKEKVVSRAV